MLKPWSAFFREILPEVTGCPDPVIELALLRAAQDFFQRTALWTLWLDAIGTLPGVIDYDIDLPRDTELVRLLRATLDGRTIAVTTPDALPADWQSYEGAGIGDCVFTRDRVTITILPRPTRDILFRAEAVVRPSDNAQGIDSAMYALYNEAIANGAKHRLMVKAGKPWSNPAEALRYEGLFNQEINTLHFRRLRGFTTARPRGRIQNF